MLRFMLNKRSFLFFLFVWMPFFAFSYQLGTLDVPYQCIPVKIEDNIKFVAANEYQTFIIREDNSLWLSGNTVYDLNTNFLQKGFVKIFDDVKELSVYNQNVMILKNDSTLWCMGNIPKEINSNILKTKYVSKPIYITENVKKICAGNSCFIYITKDNCSYFFGELFDSKSLNPKFIKKDVTEISVTAFSMQILTEKKELYTTSDGKNYKLIAENVKKTSGNFFINEKKELYAFGNIKTGSLGTIIDNENHPKLVMENVKDVSFNYWHSLILRENGALFSCGGKFSDKQMNAYSYMGFIGDGSGEPQLSPVEIAEDVIFCSVSNFTSFFIKKDGSLWGCGLNNYDESILFL